VHTERPTVSVLMSVFDGERFLQEAIESILVQTYTDFEFMIIDDGSTDASIDIVTSYKDARIRLLRNERNLGLTASLNKGLALAKGQYLARMDADDISLPTRLAKQIAFMKAHPTVGVCGTWADLRGKEYHDVWRYPTDPDLIHAHLLFASTLVHSSVIMNRTLLGKHQLQYNPSFVCAQDYELWARAARRFPLANVPEILLIHRVHAEQVGQRSGGMQQAWASNVRMSQVQQVVPAPTTEELSIHGALSTWTWSATEEFAVKAEMWLQKLISANDRSRTYPEPALSQVVAERFLAVCRSIDPQPGRLFWGSPLSVGLDRTWRASINRTVWRGVSYLGLDRIFSGCGL
jgi:glycosyl transferase family 2